MKKNDLERGNVREYLCALSDLHVAENHFNFADPEYVEAAILEMDAAKKKVSAAIVREKARRSEAVKM